MVISEDKLIAAALKKLEHINRRQCIDPKDLESRPHPGQQAIIDDFGKILTQWIVCGNRSGKTAIGARLVAWIFENDFEFLPNYPEDKKDRRKEILLLGKTTKQTEGVQWAKVKSLLTNTDYKEVRSGNQLQKVVHRENGNTITLFSFDNENQARERAQGFDGDVVWLDEMPKSADFVAELVSRVLTTGGSFLATFTPLVVSAAIKKMVESAREPHAKRYRMTLWQNPLNQIPANRDRIKAEFAHLSKAMYNTRVNGEWSSSELAVYPWRPDEMESSLPGNYSPAWPHVEGADPAVSSKHGFVLLAQDPSTQFWYVVKAEYIEGVTDVTDLIETVKEKTAGYNIVRRVCDAANPWYTMEAAKHDMIYTIPHDKNSRRDDMISKVNSGMGKYIFVTPWCEDLQDELLGCQWHPDDPTKIVNSKKYHLLDAMRYAIDMLPKFKGMPANTTWAQEIRQAHREERALEYKLSKAKTRLGRQQVVTQIKRTRRNRWR